MGLLLLAQLLGYCGGEEGTSCDNFGTCSQLCTGNATARNCSCLEGIKLADNGWSCNPIDDDSKFIYASSDSVWVVSKIKRGLNSTKITSDEGRPVDVTYDAKSNVIYYTDCTEGHEAIYRASLQNTADVEVIVDTGLLLPDGIAFDWIAGNIYFVDSAHSRIGVCKNDSSTCAVLIQERSDKPKGIALNPNLGLMFWTDWGNVPSIVRAGMDGSLPLQIISTGLTWPNGIAVDQGNNRIYWVDAGLDNIESSRYDGTDRRVVATGSFIRHPFGLDVFGDRIYWTDLHSHEIRSAGKFNINGSIVQLYDLYTMFYGLAVFHQANQPILRSNPCASSSCSHICTLSPTRNYTCFCPPGMHLAGNEVTCIEPDDTVKLVVAYKDALHFMRVGGIAKAGFHLVHLLPPISSISSMVYNPVNHTLILSDAPSKKIFEYDLRSKQLKALVDRHLDIVQCMDIEVVGENLYWADKGTKTIKVMAFRTGSRVVISRDLQNVFDILIIPENRELYVATSDGGRGKIYKLSMNGLNLKTFQTFANKEPIVLSYDRTRGNILWADKLSHDVTSVSFNHSYDEEVGSNGNEGGLPSDMAFYGSTLYYVDTLFQNISVFRIGVQKSTPHVIPMETYKHNASSSTNETKYWTKMTIINKDLSVLEDQLSRHDCAINNPLRKNCSHLCLLTGEEFVGTCYCPEGLTLDDDAITCVPLSACLPNQFSCDRGHCISKTYVCDGVADCEGREDEIDCEETPCPPNMFKCPTGGKCIPEEWVCDHAEDCAGGHDEMNCTTFCNEELEFMCEKVKKCIPKSWRCDGAIDCAADGSDEKDCNLTCPAEFFKCGSSDSCILVEWLCDNEEGCLDGSDEVSCNKTLCGDFHFMCVNGSCIRNEAVCDGKRDCSDGGDEAHCGSMETVLTDVVPSYNATGPLQETSVTPDSSIINTTEPTFNYVVPTTGGNEADQNRVIIQTKSEYFCKAAFLLLCLVIVALLGIYVVPRCTKRELPAGRPLVQRWRRSSTARTTNNIPELAMVHQEATVSMATLNDSKMTSEECDGESTLRYSGNEASENTCLSTETVDPGLHFVSFKDTENLISPAVLQNKSAKYFFYIFNAFLRFSFLRIVSSWRILQLIFLGTLYV